MVTNEGQGGTARDGAGGQWDRCDIGQVPPGLKR